MSFNYLRISLMICLYVFSCSREAEGRKALGGSGGLHNRGAPKPKTEANDPMKVASIGSRGWQLPPLDSEELIKGLGKEHRDVAQYISHTLAKAPLVVQLKKKPIGVKANSFQTQEKYRALVSVGSNKKIFSDRLKSAWFIGSERAFSQTSAVQKQSEDLLTRSYEYNTSKLYPSHFVLEVFLPKTKACKGGNPLVTYSIPFGTGTTSPKSKVSQANGFVTVYPKGRKRKSENDSDEGIVIGSTSLHLHAGASLVDPSWARGRKYFWKGRDVGTL
jgi:hypothetical protein